MRQLIWAAMLALAACAAKPAPEPVSLRDPKGWISSAVIFDPARFGGTWHVAQSGVAGCAGAKQNWAWTGTGYVLSGVDCSGTKPRQLEGRLAMTGPGARFTPTEAFGKEPVWVLWVDQDYRIAVLGTPSGHFGQVLVREMPGRGDLMTAAHEVLDFNSYDTRRIGR
ncbi:lipocalin [Sinirhodobacter ferrireducens]|uniref:Lipocalin n=1 Tax=Paenirhodobacter ferrireducens TaxID=1215032 RepID=A0A443LJI5_9RHOB|nr:lipocalin [Sinirhodobacter ferrireducens]RWR49336.1 lipocalin [Sinirhodobacter ferrireducens]